MTGLETPPSRVNDENLGGIVAVLRVDAPRRLPRCPNIETVRNTDVDVLFRIFRDARPDDREVLFALAAGRPSVDECRRTGDQIRIPYEARFHVRLGRLSLTCSHLGQSDYQMVPRSRRRIVLRLQYQSHPCTANLRDAGFGSQT